MSLIESLGKERIVDNGSYITYNRPIRGLNEIYSHSAMGTAGIGELIGQYFFGITGIGGVTGFAAGRLIDIYYPGFRTKPEDSGLLKDLKATNEDIKEAGSQLLFESQRLVNRLLRRN